MMASSDRPIKSMQEKDAALRKYKIDVRLIVKEKPLGHAYGSVVEGVYGKTPCAVKKIHKVLLAGHVHMLDQSLSMFVRAFYDRCHLLSTLRHPNIVQFLGMYYYNDSSSCPCLVMEKMETDLHNLLETNPAIPLEVKYKIFVGVACGLNYLHSQTPPIPHQDLSACHILLDSSQTAKLSDIGYNDLLYDDFSDRCPAFPVHLPPEVFGAMLEPYPCTTYHVSADMFSFGVLCLFTLTQVFPRELKPPTYYDARSGKLLARNEIERRDPYIQTLKSTFGEAHPLVQLVLSCLQNDPKDRPSAAAVCDQLESFQSQVPDDWNMTKLEMIHYIEETRREKEEEVSELRKQLENKPQRAPPISEDLVQQLLQEQASLQDRVQTKDQNIRQQDDTISQLQQDITHQRRLNDELTVNNRQTAAEVARLQHEMRDVTTEKNQIQQQQHQLQEELIQATADKQQLQQQLVGLRRLLSARNAPNSREIEFWQVSREEVTIHEDQVLGGGAWGYVAKGTFRGKVVAVKCVHPTILQQSLERVRREIRTMAQIRHPNLVLFMAAVVDEQTGPLIVTEILDMTLRQAVETNRLGPNKRSVFKDVSAALVYLHQHKEPIIHRDVSTANVLLSASTNNTWIAKLSDFGSANLVRYATTPGEGAIVYTAPEAYPQHPSSPSSPLPQTPKIDVYSFGVLACEVITRLFPDPSKLAQSVDGVRRIWPQIHPTVNSCIQYSSENRPEMFTVLAHLNELHFEP